MQTFSSFSKEVILLLATIIPFNTLSQDHISKINPDLLEKRWSAGWISHPEATGTGYGVFHFRKSFNLDSKPGAFIIHVSADNRYRLFVNGKPVGFGPARGNVMNWRYETYDIASDLKDGENVIAAVIWNFGEHRPLAQFTLRTAFILQGNSEKESILNTGMEGWRVVQNLAYKPIPVDYTMVSGFFVAGPGDMVDASLYPWGWERRGYDDSKWISLKPSRTLGTPKGFYGYSGTSGWNLVPRKIPMMEDRITRFQKVVRASEKYIDDGFIKGTSSMEVPKRSKVKILLDQKELSIGYPELIVSGGKNSTIQISYAEALVDKEGNKGNRNETTGKELKGYIDIFNPDGGNNRLFRPLWYRTFRYVELNIETGDSPLIIEDFSSVFSAYPFQRIAEFHTEEPVLNDIWNVGWRTARLCATEIYMDCPYYEQLQYVGDTRIQSLISLYLTGDDRLMKNSILQFDQSRIPEGLTYSRYPSYIPQMSPPYSLIWVLMIHDFYMLKQDPGFTKQFLLGIDNVLNWFEQRLDKTGLLGKLTYSNYMDAAPGFGPAGSPPSAEEGQSAQITLLYAYSLDHAAVLADFHKQTEQAMHYRKLSGELKSAVYKTCYDSDKKLFAETPEKVAWTQHTNILAVLTDAIPESEQQDLIKRIMHNNDLIPAQIYFSFYLMQAMKKVGIGDEYLENLEPWESMIEQGLTTFAEHHLEGRSDCHAWSAHPCFDFLATVCGIETDGPGFRSIKIAPHLGRLNKVDGFIPHPEGEIHVNLSRKGEDGITGTVEIPTNLKGTFHWNGQVVDLKGGRQFIEFE